MRIEAEHNELILENEYGDRIIVPANRRAWAQRKLAKGSHSSIDRMAESLPAYSDYAQGGSVIQDPMGVLGKKRVQQLERQQRGGGGQQKRNDPFGLFAAPSFQDEPAPAAEEPQPPAPQEDSKKKDSTTSGGGPSPSPVADTVPKITQPAATAPPQKGEPWKRPWAAPAKPTAPGMPVKGMMPAGHFSGLFPEEKDEAVLAQLKDSSERIRKDIMDQAGPSMADIIRSKDNTEILSKFANARTQADRVLTDPVALEDYTKKRNADITKKQNEIQKKLDAETVKQQEGTSLLFGSGQYQGSNNDQIALHQQQLKQLTEEKLQLQSSVNTIRGSQWAQSYLTNKLSGNGEKSDLEGGGVEIRSTADFSFADEERELAGFQEMQKQQEGHVFGGAWTGLTDERKEQLRKEQKDKINRSVQNIQIQNYTTGAQALQQHYAVIAANLFDAAKPGIQELNKTILAARNTEDPRLWQVYKRQYESIMKQPEVRAFFEASKRSGEYGEKYASAPDLYPQVKRAMKRQAFTDALFDKRLEQWNVWNSKDKATKIFARTPFGAAVGGAAYLWHGIFGSVANDEDINDIAKRTGEDPDTVKSIMHEKVGGFLVSADPLRVVGASTGIARGVDETVANTAMGLNRFFGVDNVDAKNRLIQDEETRYMVAAQKNKLVDDFGKWNFNPFSILNQMGYGTGQTAVLAAPTLAGGSFIAGLGAAAGIVKAWEVGATLGGGYFSTYEPAYKDAARYTDDEDKRRSYANSIAWVNALPELLLSPAEQVRRMQGLVRPGKDMAFNEFVRMAEKDGLEKTTKAMVYQRFGKEVGEQLLAENIEEFTTNVGQFLIEDKSAIAPYIAQYNKDHNIQSPSFAETSLQTLVQTTIQTLPMAIGGGIGMAHDMSGIRKEALFHAGNEADTFRQRLQELFDNGKMNEATFNEKMKIVNTMEGIVAQVNNMTDKDGQPYSVEAKQQVAVQEYRKAVNKQMADQGQTITAAKDDITTDNAIADALQKEAMGNPIDLDKAPAGFLPEVRNWLVKQKGQLNMELGVDRAIVDHARDSQAGQDAQARITKNEAELQRITARLVAVDNKLAPAPAIPEELQDIITGTPVFGPAKSLIGTIDNGVFTPVDKKHMNGPDLQLVENPEELNKYLASKGITPPAAKAAAVTGEGAVSFKTGDKVMFNGQERTIQEVHQKVISPSGEGFQMYTLDNGEFVKADDVTAVEEEEIPVIVLPEGEEEEVTLGDETTDKEGGTGGTESVETEETGGAEGTTGKTGETTEEPTDEQVDADRKAGKFRTITYEKEEDVPERLRDRMRVNEVEGVKTISVTLPESLADFYEGQEKKAEPGLQPLDLTVRGTSGELKFTADKKVPFRWKLVEADQLQASHNPDGTRNVNHTIAGAQPKERSDAGSMQAQTQIAANPNFAEVSAGPNPYGGAPVVNERNEVIQGNNRSLGLKKHYNTNKVSTYKQALAQNAATFGFTAEQVNNMKNPVLVREVAVDDHEAVQLGQADVKDLETGGQQRIDPLVTSRKMSEGEKSTLASLAFDENKTVNQAIRDNQKEIGRLLKPHLNPAQLNTAFKANGELTADGIADVTKVIEQLLFDVGEGNKNQFAILPRIFNEFFSATMQNGLRKALPSLYDTPKGKSLLGELQGAMMAAGKFIASGTGSFQDWTRQRDVETGLPTETWTPVELALANQLVTAKTQSAVAKIFSDYANLVRDQPATMFDAAKPGMSKEQAIEQLFNIPANEQQSISDTAVESDDKNAAETEVGDAEDKGTAATKGAAETAGTDTAETEDTAETKKTGGTTTQPGQQQGSAATTTTKATKTVTALKKGDMAVADLRKAVKVMKPTIEFLQAQFQAKYGSKQSATRIIDRANEQELVDIYNAMKAAPADLTNVRSRLNALLGVTEKGKEAFRGLLNTIKINGRDVSDMLDLTSITPEQIKRINDLWEGRRFVNQTHELRRALLVPIEARIDFWKKELQKLSVLNKEGDISETKTRRAERWQNRIDRLNEIKDTIENELLSNKDIEINGQKLGAQTGSKQSQSGLGRPVGITLDEDTQDLIKSGKATVRDVLQSMVDAPVDEEGMGPLRQEYTELARQLLEIGDEAGLDVPVNHTPDATTSSYVYKVAGKNNQLIGSEDRIDMRSLNMPEMLHEILHAFTAHKIDQAIGQGFDTSDIQGRDYKDLLNDYMQKPDGDRAIKDLIVAYQTAIRELGHNEKIFAPRKGLANQPQSMYGANLPYGLGNLHEFLAEGFSNHEFQDAMNRIKVPGSRKTLWQRVVDSVSRVLGLYKRGSVEPNSVLHRLLESGANIAAQERTGVTKIKQRTEERQQKAQKGQDSLPEAIDRAVGVLEDESNKDNPDMEGAVERAVNDLKDFWKKTKQPGAFPEEDVRDMLNAEAERLKPPPAPQPKQETQEEAKARVEGQQAETEADTATNGGNGGQSIPGVTDHKLQSGDVATTALYKTFTEDYYHKKPEDMTDVEYLKQSFEQMYDDGRQMIEAAEEHFAQQGYTDFLQWAPRLFDYIKTIPGNDLSPKTAILMGALVQDIQNQLAMAEKNKSANLNELKAFDQQVMSYFRRYMTARGKEIVSIRAHRLFIERNMADWYNEVVADKDTQNAKDDIAVAQENLDNNGVDDQTADTAFTEDGISQDEADQGNNEDGEDFEDEEGAVPEPPKPKPKPGPKNFGQRMAEKRAEKKAKKQQNAKGVSQKAKKKSEELNKKDGLTLEQTLKKAAEESKKKDCK